MGFKRPWKVQYQHSGFKPGRLSFMTKDQADRRAGEILDHGGSVETWYVDPATGQESPRRRVEPAPEAVAARIARDEARRPTVEPAHNVGDVVIYLERDAAGVPHAFHELRVQSRHWGGGEELGWGYYCVPTTGAPGPRCYYLGERGLMPATDRRQG